MKKKLAFYLKKTENLIDSKQLPINEIMDLDKKVFDFLKTTEYKDDKDVFLHFKFKLMYKLKFKKLVDNAIKSLSNI